MNVLHQIKWLQKEKSLISENVIECKTVETTTTVL